MRAIILCAGCGHRLKQVFPIHKILLHVGTDRILDQILSGMRMAGLTESDLVFVVGWEADELVRQLPVRSSILLNNRWMETNTCGSLRLATSRFPNEDLIVVNGDVVAHQQCFTSVVASTYSCALVSQDMANLGDEEVKYTLTTDGLLDTVGKKTCCDMASGEVLGINKIVSADRGRFDATLQRMSESTFYDEAFSGGYVRPLTLRESLCVEIDTPSDLQVARELFSRKPPN